MFVGCVRPVRPPAVPIRRFSMPLFNGHNALACCTTNILLVVSETERTYGERVLFAFDDLCPAQLAFTIVIDS